MMNWPNDLKKQLLCLAGIFAMLPLTGCVQTTATPAPNRRPTAAVPNFLDPCGDQVQDLAGAMLTYYVAKHKVPPTLNELQPYAGVGQILNFTCPLSGKPYIYNRDGLVAAGKNFRIYIYDATPAHDGGRWCVVWREGASVGAEGLIAEKISEKAFQEFHPAEAPKPATPSPAVPTPGN